MPDLLDDDAMDSRMSTWCFVGAGLAFLTFAMIILLEFDVTF